MEIIPLQGYSEEEKVHIANRYLIPRQIKENGITAEQIEFPEEAVRYIMRHYTREAGVRKLEQTIGTVCRKQARRVVEGNTEKLVVTREMLKEFLGGIQVRVETEVAERVKRPGVAVGLAWTPAGGDILFIEANKMKGKGGFTMTGQIGEVMQESMQAALTWVRSNAAQLGLAEDFTKDIDLHIHVPAGAIPKDGPSAGVTMATVLASLLTDTPVRPLTAMTGEITLSGNVLPVGGIKEKFLAARRAGVQHHHPACGEPAERGRGPDAGDDGGRDSALRQPDRRRAGSGAAAAGGASAHAADCGGWHGDRLGVSLQVALIEWPA